MGDLMRILCEATRHAPRDHDPTGGDPWMGGPVAITICDRCGIELPHSDTAKAFNVEVQRLREEREAKAVAEHLPLRRHWWQRRVRCSCGWRENYLYDHATHAQTKAQDAGWGR